MYSPIKEGEWTKKLTKKLGYKPYFWDGIQHSRDQLIGILRELEDGHDPWGGERNKQSVDYALSRAHSKPQPRDDRDEELGKMVDNGTWRKSPETKARHTLGKTGWISSSIREETDEVVELDIFKRINW